MSDNVIQLPPHAVELVRDGDDIIYVVTANGENGLEAKVVDVRRSTRSVPAPHRQ